MSKHAITRVGAIASIFFLALVVYLSLIRPWQLRWGATDEEVARPMPGDEILASPELNATRAITIRAPPEEIWPWIVQIGDRRAGFYGYDWFDNRGQRSATRIIPELQRLEVGDSVPIVEGFAYERVHSVDPLRSMVWVSIDHPTTGSWTWVLKPIDKNHTRLITRLRGSYQWTSPVILFQFLIDWGDFPFMRKSMLGIKQRAEGEITDTYAGAVAEGVQWGIALLEFLAAVVLMFRRHWWRPWLVALATGLVFGLIFYVTPPLWIGFLLEIAIFLGLLWSYRTAVRLSNFHRQAS
jgi:hypothetical protein